MSDPAPRPAARPQPYAGDESLARLLAEAGVTRSWPEVEALVAGIAAAAPPQDPRAALELVAPAAGHDLGCQLVALIAELRARYGGSAEPGPAPAERLAKLRQELARRGLDGFVVPLSDEHQGEYIPPRAWRLAWLTGFTGSAGAAVVLADEAAIFVDGRYTLQAEAQVDSALFARRHLIDEPPAKWLAATLESSAKLGYDPWLHTKADAERLASACSKAGAELVACADNPLDAVWPDQPPPPLSPVVPHDLVYAGESAGDKRARLAQTLAEAGEDAAVLTDPASVAWLLNLRGGDVAHTPLPLSFALLHADAAVYLFADPRKLSPGLGEHLGNAVSLRRPEDLGPALDGLGAAGMAVRADPASAAAWIFERLEAAGARVVREADPCALPKACKNAVELAGARAAHLRDGAALSRFLAWLDGAAPGGEVDELGAARVLEGLRAEDGLFQGLSFDTISGAGPNGAIVHYRVSAASNRRLEPGTLYLVDSGAQYLDGTTDVTRTVAIGAPSEEHRARFTAVLKGHIALARARFPEGTTGTQLDTLARQALWRTGLDYDHGTGHGVGSYLGVHEGPQRISKLPNKVGLRPGMIVSNEPGYYKQGAYGIRIENLITVVECPDIEGAEKAMLAFETLTRAPIDLRLVAPSLMSEDEIAWLDDYHREVREALAPLVDAGTANWLGQATRPLGA
ncbi:MAG: aminopeptidase P family protein [Alphaproteobacteria bacterium]|nr:aminopeptidase P family protein [Alphaproteobacteria bacterium]